MRYIKLYEAFMFIHKFDFINKKETEIIELLRTHLFTPSLRYAVLTKYKTDTPKIVNIKKKVDNSEQYHIKWNWEISNSEIEDEKNFVFNIGIEIPRDQEFMSDNTMLSVSIWIHPVNRRKDYSEHYNNRIAYNENEENFKILSGMIIAFAEKVHKDFGL